MFFKLQNHIFSLEPLLQNLLPQWQADGFSQTAHIFLSIMSKFSVLKSPLKAEK